MWTKESEQQAETALKFWSSTHDDQIQTLFRAALSEIHRQAGELATESAERIRCRDGWQKAEAERRADIDGKGGWREVVDMLRKSEAALRAERMDALHDLAHVYNDIVDPDSTPLRDAYEQARAERDDYSRQVQSLNTTIIEMRGHMDDRAMYLGAAEDACGKAEAENAALRADLAAAAGELRVPMPEPGTDMARLLAANVLLRAERDRLKRKQDCRYAGAGLADFSGIHCPPNAPCLRCQMDRLREALSDTIELAAAAMREANRDGAEYDIAAELTEARAALAAQGSESKPAEPAKCCDCPPGMRWMGHYGEGACYCRCHSGSAAQGSEAQPAPKLAKSLPGPDYVICPRCEFMVTLDKKECSNCGWTRH